jgi:hypothetical protein
MNEYLDQLNFGLAALPAAVLLLTSSLGLGLVVLRRLFRLEPKDRLAYGLAAIAVGLNLTALLVLAAGSIGVLNAVTIWSFLIAASIPAVLAGREIGETLIGFVRRHWLFTILLAAGFTMILGSALCYPYAWDERSYQVAVPYRWLSAGTLEVFMDNPYSAFPSLPQFISRMFLEIGGIFMPRIVCCLLYGLFFLGLYRLLSVYTARLYATVLVASLFLSPVFLIMMREVYAEPFILLALTAVFLLPLAVGRRQAGKIWALSGFFCGAMVAVKLTGAGVVLPVLFYLWFALPGRRQTAPERRRGVLWFALAAAVFALPFYLRAYLYAGNPFYPFLNPSFGLSEADCLAGAFHHAMGDRYFGLKTVSSLFTGPILAAVYDLYALDSRALFDGIALGWQFLLLAAAGVGGALTVLRRGGRDIFFGGVLGMFGLFYLFWFFSSQQTRFLLPACFFAALLAARSLKLVKPLYAQLFLGVLLFGTLYSIQPRQLSHYKTAWQIACTPRNTAHFLKQTSGDPGYMEALTYLAEQTPSDARVLLVLERRGLYVPRRYDIAAPYFQSKFLTPVPETAEGVFGAIAASGADYVLAGITRANLDHIADFDEENNRLLNLLAELEKSKRLKLEFQLEYFWIFKVVSDRP